MSKQRILMIVAMCFVLIGTVAAGIPHEPKPDSVVTCVGLFGSPMVVDTYTFPTSIDSTECVQTPTGFQPCSPCIRSLENQGCEVVDLVTDSRPRVFSLEPDRTMAQAATFQLSCESP
jgi:hypothetical protein